MTINEAKGKAAREFGFVDWRCVTVYSRSRLSESLTDRAMELYAESKAKEAYNQAIMDAAKSAEAYYDIPTEQIEVSKQSILKLLKK